MLNEHHMGGMVGDEIVALPSDHGYISAHPGAIAAFDFIGAFSAVPTPQKPVSWQQKPALTYIIEIIGHRSDGCSRYGLMAPLWPVMRQNG